VIYIDTPAVECHNRLRIRNRGEEAGVELSYLESLEKQHLKWFQEGEDKFEVAHVDAIENYVDDIGVQQKVLKQIRDIV
jgi:deoxyadenosine/deoxycytidine kinase